MENVFRKQKFVARIPLSEVTGERRWVLPLTDKKWQNSIIPRMPLDEKVMHALCYIAGRIGSCSKLVALKVLYLADRWHLRKYGRTVTDDKYYAMLLGPVPSRAKFLIEDHFKDVLGAEEYLTITNSSKYEWIAAKSEPNLDWLSVSDRQALDAAVNTYKKYGYDNIVNFVHLFPEWKNKAPALKDKRCVKMDMDDFFLDCLDKSKEYCDATEEQVNASREYFKVTCGE